MKKITPFLWFDNKAEEAARYYTRIFKNSKVKDVARYDEVSAAASGRAAGSVMTVSFTLNGQEFTALNGGPLFEFTPAISFVVNCDTQKEIDWLWKKLSEGGRQEVCGWLKDRYGVSWQIVPSALARMMQSKDRERTRRVMEAVLKMKKIDLKTLQNAYGKR